MIQPIGSIYTENFYAMRNTYQPRRDIPKGASPHESGSYVTDIVDLSPEAQAVIEFHKNNVTTQN